MHVFVNSAGASDFSHHPPLPPPPHDASFFFARLKFNVVSKRQVRLLIKNVDKRKLLTESHAKRLKQHVPRNCLKTRGNLQSKASFFRRPWTEICEQKVSDLGLQCKMYTNRLVNKQKLVCHKQVFS